MLCKRLGVIKTGAGIADKDVNVCPADREAREPSQWRGGTHHKIIEVTLLKTDSSLHVHELGNLQGHRTCKDAKAFA